MVGRIIKQLPLTLHGCQPPAKRGGMTVTLTSDCENTPFCESPETLIFANHITRRITYADQNRTSPFAQHSTGRIDCRRPSGSSDRRFC